MPSSDGPLSRHQKYFLQSRGCGKNPSSSHLKSVPESGVVGGAGVVVVLPIRFATEYSSYLAVEVVVACAIGRLGRFFLLEDAFVGAAVVVLLGATDLDGSRELPELKL